MKIQVKGSRLDYIEGKVQSMEAVLEIVPASEREHEALAELLSFTGTVAAEHNGDVLQLVLRINRPEQEQRVRTPDEQIVSFQEYIAHCQGELKTMLEAKRLHDAELEGQ